MTPRQGAGRGAGFINVPAGEHRATRIEDASGFWFRGGIGTNLNAFGVFEMTEMGGIQYKGKLQIDCMSQRLRSLCSGPAGVLPGPLLCRSEGWIFLPCGRPRVRSSMRAVKGR